MAHTLIIGMSESGKTTLAISLARFMKSQGIGTLVLDPLRNPEWQADFITADQEEFLRVFWASRKCAVFIDEGGKSVGRYNIAMQECVTMGRHAGHAVSIIAQKATQLAPVVRDMCAGVFCFSVAPSSAKMLAEDFNNDLILKASTLRQFEFIRVEKFGESYQSKVEAGNYGQISNGVGRGNLRLGSSGGSAGQGEVEEITDNPNDADNSDADSSVSE